MNKKIIISIIVALSLIVVCVGCFFVIKLMQENFSKVGKGKEKNKNVHEIISEAQDNLSEMEKNAFNEQFISFEGTNMKGSTVKVLINTVVTSNENNDKDRQVILSGDIKQITDVSPRKTYTVKLNYGENGLINSIFINNN